ncbi:TonB system transport protein ExbD [Campylobacter sputorum subsp. bubulus]|uniref:Biopolymer transport protein ExbD n=1 Tax=Campylobacter sputorum subsp. sputorum TaxID=32024 RepID=A0A381DIC5_9BACT|nr:TonB system transport protein ExbD [Campylobacter sputorum]ASM35413.1 TonB system transport protein ExbD [Campylobacter sputorum aubsp. sputorum RM3237]ASM37109.1 TonB system transport protein ExbD [Campylobacter sputorum bv. faecalis CCUG 20703]ASM38780.1 TonB system transport protein ExbD [Campylobacter sputorum bv. paraureolyticus LMG 11764]KAB0582843.1 TonB system transport protein ExbD [Campylobacter sputorum subsp. sputorum]MDY6120568.1 TonB system transport protein ExbD [Campylobacte
MKRNSIKKDGLNVIPLIDIMLVLLCMVLSISTFIAQGNINIDLPKSKSGSLEKDTDIITISIDSNSTIYLNDKILSQEEFQKELSSIDRQTPIILKSDKDAKFESFVRVIDILKLNKHENFKIATQVRD